MAQEQTKRGGGGGDDDDLTSSTAAGQAAPSARIVSASPSGRANSASPSTASAGVATPLGLDYPSEFFSLSHVALPFPTDDSLYGRTPQGPAQFGIRLGTLAARGENGALVVSMDQLMRVSSNPFYPYMLQRIRGF